MNYLNKERYSKKNQFGPRVNFNHGYHDAALDAQDGRPRELHKTLHDTRHVSPAFDVMYFEGYKAGLIAVKEGTYVGNSEHAWLTFRETLTDEQLSEIYQSEVSAHMYGCKKEYVKYRLPDAERHAKEVVGKPL